MPVCPWCQSEHPEEASQCPSCGTAFEREWERPTTQRITLDLSEYSELIRYENEAAASALIVELERHDIKVRLVDFDPASATVVQRIMVHDKHRQRAEEILSAFEKISG